MDQNTIRQVWEKARAIDGYDPSKYRKDECGAWIAFEQYGKRNKLNLGWEIDHITPQSKGGSDMISNLRPLHWENNVQKSNGRLSKLVTAKGNENAYV